MERMPSPPRPDRRLRNILSDPDKDGYPNAVDCNDNNPNKQGALSWVISKVQKRPYAEVETQRKAARSERQDERHQEKLKRLQYQKEEMEAKRPIKEMRMGEEKHRMTMAKERLVLQEKRQKMMPKMGAMPSMFGSTSTGKMPSPFVPIAKFGGVTPTVKRKHRKKTKRRRQKSKGSKFIIIGGKAYRQG